MVIAGFGWSAAESVAILARRSDNRIELRWTEDGSLPNMKDEPDLAAFCYLRNCRHFQALTGVFDKGSRPNKSVAYEIAVNSLAVFASEQLKVELSRLG